MSDSGTVTASALAPRLRHMSKDELPDLLPTNPRNSRQDGAGDSPEAGCLRERVGWVAEVRGRVAGSLIYDVVQPSAGPRGADSHRSLMDLLLWLLGGCRVQPLQVEVLDVTIAPAPYWEAVERALLGRLVEELQCSCGRAPVVLPESNLAVQLFLRNAPYRAVRVLRGYYGDEDGYFMAQASP